MSTYIDKLEQNLPNLPHRIGVAVAAECAERVRNVWAMYQEPCDDLYHALDLSWQYAISGVLSPKIKEYYDIVVDLMQPFRDDPDVEYHTLLSIALVLEYTLESEYQSIFRSLTAAVDTATAVDRDNQEKAKDEEVSFQLSVLERALPWGAKPIFKGMFDDLWTTDDPEWISRAQG